MRVLLISFGKLKMPGLRQVADEYIKRMRPWAPIEEIELKPIPVPDKSAATRQRIQEQEAKLLLSKLGDRTPYYLLDEGGKSLPTSGWAEHVRKWEGSATPAIAVCIGGSLGFSAELKKRAQGTLALGPQTLSHELARIVCLEQLYRAWSVVRGHPYHNEG